MHGRVVHLSKLVRSFPAMLSGSFDIANKYELENFAFAGDWLLALVKWPRDQSAETTVPRTWG